ncbi:MDIS1-interacting receptor like kinase 2-like [Lycium barbarum]|uniref:MDIS1-interacting receptor like kinase 2-like n=1 Tax=Lycium barbarum TaxID=112863 RepID=UPI00293F5AC3|nr:MDIS1-interacting receptor like kinase 2-like [Lycium barbarum]
MESNFPNKNNFLLASRTLSPTGSKNSSSDEEASPDACMGYYGVICFNGCVNRLNITTASVIGTLHEFAFSSLPFLDYVDLSMNQLSGTIPPEIGKIPPQIGSLKNLEVLHIYVNQLNGSIPGEIGHLSPLTRLDLSTNVLNGSIPVSLENLNNLLYFHLYENQLSSSIAAEIGKLINLVELYLDRN